MKDKIKFIFSEQFTRVSLILSVVFLIPLLVVVVLTYDKLPPLVPFYNSMPWGEERLLESNAIIIMPIILLSVFLANIFIAVTSYAKYVLIARILSINTFLFFVLGTLAYLQILFLTF